MIIIIEGPDLCYKTTVASKLTEVLPNAYLLKSNRPNFQLSDKQIDDWSKERLDMFYQVYDCFFNEKLDIYIKLVFDRLIWSHAVYSKLTNRYFDEKWLFEFDKKVARWNDVYLIVLYADNEELERRFRERGDKFFGIEQIKIANRLYFEYVNSSAIPHIFINTTNKTSDEIVKEIITWLKQ